MLAASYTDPPIACSASGKTDLSVAMTYCLLEEDAAADAEAALEDAFWEEPLFEDAAALDDEAALAELEAGATSSFT